MELLRLSHLAHLTHHWLLLLLHEVIVHSHVVSCTRLLKHHIVLLGLLELLLWLGLHHIKSAHWVTLNTLTLSLHTHALRRSRAERWLLSTAHISHGVHATHSHSYIHGWLLLHLWAPQAVKGIVLPGVKQVRWLATTHLTLLLLGALGLQNLGLILLHRVKVK